MFEAAMRIILTDFHNDWGGQAFQVLLLAQAMRERGHATLVMCPPGSALETRCREAGLPVNTRVRFRRGLRAEVLTNDLPMLRQSIREFQPDIIHCHGSQDSWQVALSRLGNWLSPVFRRVALVRTKHNSYPVKPSVMNRLLYGRIFHRTIAVAENIRQGILACGLPDSPRLVTLHAGLPDDFGQNVPQDARASVREEFRLPPDAILIGLVGRLMREKGQEVLMEATLRLRETFPNLHLLLIGDGGEYDKLLETRDRLGLAENVHFTLARTDIARLTSALDMSVLAATGCDASSTVLKEAMSLHIPVVGTDVGGTREILEDGTCGKVVAPNDAESLADAIAETLRIQGTESGRSHLDHAAERIDRLYRMKSVAARTEEIYRQALEEIR